MGKRGPKPKFREEVIEIKRPTTLEEARERNRVIDEELARLDAKDAEISEQERVYREQNKIEFFEPIRTENCLKCGKEIFFDWTINKWQCLPCGYIKIGDPPYQKETLKLLHAGKKTITLQGANRIGKTTLGAVIVSSCCLGIQPWDKKSLPFPLDKPPIKVRILCEDWEDHAKGVIVPELKYWLPVGEYETSKNNVGVESLFTFRNKSTIELMTNRQDTKQHESWKGHIVWSDEPTEYDKYVANMRGLIDYNGIFLLTMTAVKESWVLDQIIRNTDSSFASITEIPIESNPYLTKEGIKRFASSIKESDKIARLQGGWLNLVGLVWPGFKPEIHLIDDFKVPTDWPVVPFIDFHPAKPQAISFYCVDPQERRYMIDERWEHHSPEETADLIICAKSSNAWNISEAFIDPLSKGDTAYVKNRFEDVPDSFSIIKERLGRHGIELNVFSRDKSSGILNVEKMLMGPNKMPLLFFFRSLTNKIKDEGHVWEIQRWTYDENQKPKDENDHFMQTLYAMSLVEMKYYPENEKRQTVAESDFDIFNPRVPETENRIEAWR